MRKLRGPEEVVVRWTLRGLPSWPALGIALAFFPQATMAGVVTGLVDATDGAPLPGATVSLTPAAGGTPVAVTTGGDGIYTTTVPAGTYHMTVSLEGFGTVNRDIVVSNDIEWQPANLELKGIV
jgi:hypothetical protein